MSLLFVDSSCDLNIEEIKKLGIECINLPYMLNNNICDFDGEIDYAEFYSRFKKGICVGRCDPDKESYKKSFEEGLKQGNDIIYVHTSSNLIDSSSIVEIRDELLLEYPDRRFELIDSMNFSIGYGLLVYNLAILYRNGLTIDEIISASEKLRDEFVLYFSVDSVEQMYNHNLVDSNAVSGTMLNIKPIFTVDIDGKLQWVDKVSGRKKVTIKLLELLRQLGENVADFPIGIMYVDNETEAKLLQEKIIEQFGSDTHIILSPASPSTSAMLGLKTLGLAFHIHKKIH